ncbi:MAG: F0F1 ATP synthase subunit B [Methylomonas sp.]|nr:F0F1 ATP synthase subunit B [Methylomonas sp.]
MSELIHSLGIEWKILIAQIANFAILFYVLKRFVFGPIMKILERREARLEADRRSSRELSVKLDEAALKEKEVLDTARKESERIISEAHAVATRLKGEIEANASREAERIIASGRAELAHDRTKAEAVLKKEIGSLIALSVEKAVGSALDRKAHEKLVEEARAIVMSNQRSL